MRKLMLILFLTCFAVMTNAQTWCLVANDSNIVKMNDIDYIVLSATGRKFSVIRTDGSVLNDLVSASFSKLDLSGINEVSAGKKIYFLSDISGNTLKLYNLTKGKSVRIVSMNGLVQIERSAESSNMSIDIGSLSKGVYVLSVGENAVKFNKR